MNITAKITGLQYKPFLCKELDEFEINNLESSVETKSNFILKIDKKNKIAVSWWVSAKRTRSYPYARVYNTLSFTGKKVTIIPIYKDEGKDGDRDFLQWDTISLMSLLGIYVIIGYYINAAKNSEYENKITNQRFDYEIIKEEINNIINYQSDALHWNLKQADKAGEIGKRAMNAYKEISQILHIEMHSVESVKKRIEKIIEGKDTFMNLSRKLAQQAQQRESITVQPKEDLDGTKSMITIINYLGGYYYFTADEIKMNGNDIYLVEGKHSSTSVLPSEEDIKDGLIKMILFTNLEDVSADDKIYNAIPVLKLSSGIGYDFNKLSLRQKELINNLKKESSENNFKLELL